MNVLLLFDLKLNLIVVEMWAKRGISSLVQLRRPPLRRLLIGGRRALKGTSQLNRIMKRGAEHFHSVKATLGSLANT